jgi:hypothetical protein
MLDEGLTPTAVLRAVLVIVLWLVARHYLPDD